MKCWVIARIRGCELAIHPLFAATLAVAALTGFGSVFLLSFAVVLVHELCHCAVAAALRYEVRRIDLLPFGGVAQMEGLGEGKPMDEGLIAMGGPAGNVLLMTFALSVNHFWPLPSDFLQLFVGVNFMMAGLNLLPAWPLDGGRILRALLMKRCGPRRAVRVCAVCGMVLSGLLCAYGVWGMAAGVCNVSVFLVAAFLAIGAGDAYRKAAFTLGEVAKGTRRETRSVNHLAARQDAPLREVVASFVPGMYNMVSVLDESGQEVALVGQDALLSALSRGGQATLRASQKR
ncbi:MAG: M50 family metallopeptidase [Eubacteriales bacterium]|nr:M50 family metallopeptidase [Eubacteriales bacterium]